MLKKIKLDQLPTYLSKVRRTFPLLRPGRPFSQPEVKQYYEESAAGYHWLNSRAGAIHMALSKDDVADKNDHFAQAEEIVALAETFGASGSVLEAGCGKGFNIGFVAHWLPKWQCTGIDLTPSHVASARQKFGALPNATFDVGDFQELEKIVGSKQDIVFCVESICHATDLKKTLGSIAQVLSDRGRLVIFDGFRTDEPVADEDWIEAAGLVEAAMAVSRFPIFSEFRSIAAGCGLVVEVEEDLSDAIMPNLIKFSDLAKSFFKIPPITRVLTRRLPQGLARNAVAGLLMPLTVTKGIHRYLKVILLKAS